MLYTYPSASISGAFIYSFYILLFTFSLLTSFLLLPAESTLDIWRGRKKLVFSKPMHWLSTHVETPDSYFFFFLAKIWLDKTYAFYLEQTQGITNQSGEKKKSTEARVFVKVLIAFSLKTSSFWGWDLELYVDWNRRKHRLDPQPSSVASHSQRTQQITANLTAKTASSPAHSTATTLH